MGEGLTARLRHCFRAHQILPGNQYGYRHRGLSWWNRKGCRIGDWRSGGYPETGQLDDPSRSRTLALTLKSPAP